MNFDKIVQAGKVCCDQARTPGHVGAGARKAIVALESRCRKLAAGLRSVENLIAHSNGVTSGLHNADTATWEELRTGGRLESRLEDFDTALEELNGQHDNTETVD